MFGIGDKKDEGDNPTGSGGGQDTVDPGAIVAGVDAKRGPGRPRKDGTSSPAGSKTPGTGVLTVEEINRLFRAKNFEKLCTMYFDTRFVVTGFEPFRLDQDDRESLSESMAVMVRTLIRIDPKYIALLIFLSTFAGLVTSKEVLWKMEQEKRKVKGGSA